MKEVSETYQIAVKEKNLKDVKHTIKVSAGVRGVFFYAG
jgi:hypothetical protein